MDLTPDNSHGCDALAEVLAQAHANDGSRLRAAAAVLGEAVQPGGLFRRIMRRKGRAPVDVLFAWPGVLMELDPAGGEIIREAAAASMGRDAPDAAAFMAAKTVGRPLKAVTFQPPQSERLRASIWADGVVRVHAVKDGALLAESEPGQPDLLRAGFRSLSAQDLIGNA